MKCKLCHETIPNNRVQQGNMHMDCYSRYTTEKFTFYKVSLGGNFYIDHEPPPYTEEFDEVKKVIMTQHEFDSLPEFQGF